MPGKVDVQDLRVGMFIYLDLGWMAHPFPMSSFRITQAQQIDKIRGLGLKQVRWSPAKSELAPVCVDAIEGLAPAAAVDVGAAPEAGARHAERERRELLAAQHARAALCQALFTEAAAAWTQAHDKVVLHPHQARRDTESLSATLVDKLLVDGDICIRLLTGDGGDSASIHAMNVAVIALLMGRTFGLSRQEMLDLGVGALLHDVGKLDLPERLRHADDHFDKEDMAAYRDHVARGVVHGRRMGLPSDALLVLAQHHEHADGSGFPLHLKLERMSVGARIVAMVNCYDKLCNPSTLAHAMAPHEALSMLFAQAKTKFDSGMLNAFIRMMGVYPVGSAIQLTDDRFALVMSVNSTRPLKPEVLVHDQTLPRSQALHVNLMATPDLGIRRSLKPAQLPPDALQYLAPRPRAAYFFEAVRAPVSPPEEAVFV